MEIEVYTKEGSTSGRKIEISDKVFNAEVNDHVVYLAVQSQMTNSRQGTRSTKTRSMVSGGGKKPWKQKGRGTARSGSSRSPVWRGGGTVHGPQPQDFSFRLPKKVKKLARISVLSGKNRDEQLCVVEDFTLDAVKTREMYTIINNFGLTETKTVVLLPEYNPDILLASRNIKNLRVLTATDASTYDLLDCKKLLVIESAIEKLEGLLS